MNIILNSENVVIENQSFLKLRRKILSNPDLNRINFFTNNDRNPWFVAF